MDREFMFKKLHEETCTNPLYLMLIRCYSRSATTRALNWTQMSMKHIFFVTFSYNILAHSCNTI